ncbi:hypothetical protein PCASD_12926 [Puccinia coronata f. sp. avenae]|uniref:Integrase catalytic domain-containing protein n=1 Tax=Puccinia coronata f. sp. avenae TaxID=200324 RepID=A0A2N5U9X1_9BASI|nr:hypothetical protein PCASD_12926 [Puccinia coronata f. sp. avenae]
MLRSAQAGLNWQPAQGWWGLYKNVLAEKGSSDRIYESALEGGSVRDRRRRNATDVSALVHFSSSLLSSSHHSVRIAHCRHYGISQVHFSSSLLSSSHHSVRIAHCRHYGISQRNTVADPDGIPPPKPSSSTTPHDSPPKEEDNQTSLDSFHTDTTGDTIRLATLLHPQDQPENIISSPQDAMSESTSHSLNSIKFYTEKLNGTNFSTWRRELYTAISLLNLDDYLITELDKLPSTTTTSEKNIKAKQATNIIRMHLDGENSARFVDDDDIGTYKPKELWDLICGHYATKSMENAATLMRTLVTYDFGNGSTNTTINDFRSTFKLFLEVTKQKFEKKTVEGLMVYWILIALPAQFALFKTLKFAEYSKPDAELTMSSFLNNIEHEIKRQADPSANLNALAVSNQKQQGQSSRSGQQKKTRRVCEGGVHNPETNHAPENCYQLNPNKGVAYHQAALNRLKAAAGVNPSSGLSVGQGISDSIVLDIFAANGSSIPIIGHGPAVVHTASGPLNISRAYFAPDLSNSLIPLTFYLQKGFSLRPTHGGSRFECRSSQGVLFTGSTTSNVLLIDLNPLRALSVNTPSVLDLHRALGHPSINYLKKAFPDVTINSIDCSVCDLSKMHRVPFSGSFPKPSRPLECIHMDLCGPITPASRGGNKYFLKIIDGYSKYRFIYPLRCKSDTFSTFLVFLNQAENFTNQRLHSVVSDNGGEFVNASFKALYSDKGIVHHTTAPYTPQQNPFAERGNRTTVEKARALLMTSGLSLSWWGDAVTTAVYLENRTPDSSIKWISPFELWNGHAPDLSRLIPFGCRVVIYEEKKWRESKFSPSGTEAIFLGYHEGHHTYKVWVPSKDVIRNTHHVRPFPEVFLALSEHKEEIGPTSLFNFDIEMPDVLPSRVPDLPLPNDIPAPSLPDNPPAPLDTPDSNNPIPSGGPEPPVERESEPPHEEQEAPSNIPQEGSQQLSSKGGWWSPAHGYATRRHMAMLLVGEPASPKDPITYAEAIGRLDGEEWLVAIGVEVDNITRHEVWVVAPLVPGTKGLDTVWVFKRKYNADGELLKHKARLCVRGFCQIEGLNYNHTFAPTGWICTLRILFGLAAARGWDIQQMDVRCAFLNGVPDEDIFIKVPDGVDIDIPPGYGLKLQKSLYGLKQSPRCWYKALRTFFESINFKPAGADPCLFIHQDIDRPCFVFVHVDDMVIFGPDVQFFKDQITSRFEMEDLGECKWVLGMRVARDLERKTVSLCQDRYINEVLEEFGMTNCRTITAPLPLNALTCPVDDSPVSPGFNYRRAVGLLNYLVQCTRPDLAFACSYLSQFLNAPKKTHENHFLHVLRYLKHSAQLRLNLGDVPGEHRLVGYSDSSYASGVEASSFSGSMVMLHGPVGWRCAKQEDSTKHPDNGPALSTTEAKYRACSETGQDLRWTEQLLDDLRPSAKFDFSSVHLYCDNQGALALLENPIYQH